jgi:hypothetical protein
MSANKWWEIEISCHPGLEEIIFWRLAEYGCNGMATHQQEGGVMLKAYLPQADKSLPEISHFWPASSGMLAPTVYGFPKQAVG